MPAWIMGSEQWRLVEPERRRFGQFEVWRLDREDEPLEMIALVSATCPFDAVLIQTAPQLYEAIERASLDFDVAPNDLAETIGARRIVSRLIAWIRARCWTDTAWSRRYRNSKPLDQTS